MMKKNMGNIDRMLRVLVAVVIAVLYWKEIIPSTLGIVLLVVAGIFVLTSLISYCPIYPILGMNTCKKKEDL